MQSVYYEQSMHTSDCIYAVLVKFKFSLYIWNNWIWIEWSALVIRSEKERERKRAMKTNQKHTHISHRFEDKVNFQAREVVKQMRFSQ